jgi:hypothetical protein
LYLRFDFVLGAVWSQSSSDQFELLKLSLLTGFGVSLLFDSFLAFKETSAGVAPASFDSQLAVRQLIEFLALPKTQLVMSLLQFRIAVSS